MLRSNTPCRRVRAGQDCVTLVEAASRLTDAMSVNPLAHVGRGYHRFRRYAPRMLRALEIEAAPVATPLMAAVCLIGDQEDTRNRSIGFVRRKSKWPPPPHRPA